jgi:hypothetical protein
MLAALSIGFAAITACSPKAFAQQWIGEQAQLGLGSSDVRFVESLHDSVYAVTADGLFEAKGNKFTNVGMPTALAEKWSKASILRDLSGGGAWLFLPDEKARIEAHKIVTNLAWKQGDSTPKQLSIAESAGELASLNGSDAVTLFRPNGDVVGPIELGFSESEELRSVLKLSASRYLLLSNKRLFLLAPPNLKPLVTLQSSDEHMPKFSLFRKLKSGQIWVILDHEPYAYVLNPGAEEPIRVTVPDAIYEVIDAGDNAPWLIVEGYLPFKYEKDEKRRPDRNAEIWRDRENLSVAVTGDRSLLVANGLRGVLIVRPTGDVTSIAQGSKGYALRNALKVIALGPSNTLVVGTDGTVQIYLNGQFSPPELIGGGVIASLQGTDGSVWIAGRGTLHRFAAGQWFDVRRPELSNASVKNVLKMPAGGLVFDLHGDGVVEYVPAQAQLVIDSIDTVKRTVTLRLEGKVSDYGALTLTYTFADPNKHETPLQRISLQGPKVTLPVPTEVGKSARLSAVVQDSIGEVVPSDPKLKMPISMPAEFGPQLGWLDFATQMGKTIPYVFAFHLVIWCLMVAAYPRSPRIQAAFFWNDSMRKIAGLGYIEFLMHAIPWMRHRLLSPFSNALVNEARLELFEAYYQGVSLSSDRKSDITVTPQEVCRRALGRAIVWGESGSGKTHLCRFLIKTRKRQAVFIPAASCEKGVMEAVAELLPPQARGLGLVETLIYQGRLDLYIDGLNEAPPAAREQVKLFVLRYPSAQFLITSQKFKWNVPVGTEEFSIMSLEREQIANYLIEIGPETSEYHARVHEFVVVRVNQTERNELLEGVGILTGNPYDLSIVSRLLVANRAVDTAYDLQDQYFSLVFDEYRKLSCEEFPVSLLCEVAHEAKSSGTRVTSGEKLGGSTIEVLLSEKILVKGPDSTYLFRHDKLQDYLTAQYLLRNRESQLNYLSDIRFVGVYQLLATKLKKDDAKFLLAQLAISATRDRDSTMLYEFVERLKSHGKLDDVTVWEEG